MEGSSVMVLYMNVCGVGFFANQVIEYGVYICILQKMSYKIFSIVIFLMFNNSVISVMFYQT